MANILDQIAEYSRSRVLEAKKNVSIDELKSKCEQMPNRDHRFLAALKKPGLSFICEVKKASPSKGIISEDFPGFFLPWEMRTVRIP